MMYKFIGIEILLFVFWYTAYIQLDVDGLQYVNEIDFEVARYTYIVLFLFNIIVFFKVLINLVKSKTFDKVSIYWQFLLLIFTLSSYYLQAKYSFIYIIVTIIYYYLIRRILYKNEEGFDQFKFSLKFSKYNRKQLFFIWTSNLIYVSIYYIFYILSFNFIEDDVSNLGPASLVKYMWGIIFVAFLLISFVQENYQLDDSKT